MNWAQSEEVFMLLFLRALSQYTSSITHFLALLLYLGLLLSWALNVKQSMLVLCFLARTLLQENQLIQLKSASKTANTKYLCLLSWPSLMLTLSGGTKLYLSQFTSSLLRSENSTNKIFLLYQEYTPCHRQSLTKLLLSSIESLNSYLV